MGGEEERAPLVNTPELQSLYRMPSQVVPRHGEVGVKGGALGPPLSTAVANGYGGYQAYGC